MTRESMPRGTMPEIPGAVGVALTEPPLSITMMKNNIHHMRTEAPLLAPVFRSEGQARLLSLLLLEDRARSLAEISAETGLAYPTVHREVARLLEAGILQEGRAGRTRLISAAEDSPLTPPLREIVLISTGPVALLAEELRPLQGIDAVFLHGSFAARMRGRSGPAPRDIDVMVVGTPDPEEVYEACARVEESVHRPVNPSIVTREELLDDSGFHTQVRADPIVPVLGEPPW